MGWFNVLMTEFIVVCLPNPHPLALSRVEPRVTKFDKVPRVKGTSLNLRDLTSHRQGVFDKN